MVKSISTFFSISALCLRASQVFQVVLDQQGKMEIQEMKANLDPWALWSVTQSFKFKFNIELKLKTIYQSYFLIYAKCHVFFAPG